jgi:hypothetical protein
LGILDFLKGRSDKDRYARAFEQTLRAAGEQRVLRYDAGEFLIRVGADPARPEGIIYLDNGFRAWQSAPDEAARREVLQRYLMALGDPHDETRAYGEVAPRLVAGVRDRAYLEFNRLAAGTQYGVEAASPTVQRPLVADIAEVLLLDKENSVTLVTESTLERWGVAWETAFAQGLANLRARSDEVRVFEYEGILAWQANDSFDAGRVLLTEALARIPVRGELVALVPDRDVLLLAGSEDVAQLRALAAVAHRRFEQSQRLLSGWPLVLRGGHWDVFEPPAEVATEFRRLARRYAAVSYRQQSEVLQKYREAVGEDVFVGSWLLEAADDAPPGEFTTLAVWSEDIVTLLPEVDEVVFNGADGVMYRVSWARVRAAVAHLMQPTEYSPARWQVDGFPTPGELLEMGARRVGG